MRYCLDKSDTYERGFQMSQEKWDGTPEQANEVAQHASQADYDSVESVGRMTSELPCVHRNAESSTLILRWMQRFNIELSADPNHGELHWQKSRLWSAMGNGSLF